jgi:hypothetical protein
MSRLTHEERLEQVSQSLAAVARGDYDESLRITQQRPLTPWIAKSIKEVFGQEYLSGWDLSAAEAEYGQNWLSQ